jgi:hypothetical protein
MMIGMEVRDPDCTEAAQLYLQSVIPKACAHLFEGSFSTVKKHGPALAKVDMYAAYISVLHAKDKRNMIHV